MKNPEIPDYAYVVDDVGLEAALSALSGQQAIALDVETAYPRDERRRAAYDNIYNLTDKGTLAPFDPHTAEVRLLQLKGESTPPFVIDLWRLEEPGRSKLARWLASYEGTYLGQNIRFDMKQLKGSLNIWIDQQARIFDAMQCSRLLANSVGMGAIRGHSLAALARDFLDVGLDKTEQASDWSVPELSSEQLGYAALDVCFLHDLRDFFVDALVNQLGQSEPYELEMKVIGPTARMEWSGVPFNPKVYRKVQEAARYALPSLLSRIGKVFREEVGQPPILSRIEIQRNDGSSDWKSYYLPWCDGKVGKDFLMSRAGPNSKILKMIQAMGLVDDEGKPLESSRKGLLEGMKSDNPGIAHLLNYWDLAKQTQFKYEDYVHPLTKRIHARYNPSGASTGRFSCQSPNLQQVPSKFNMTHPDGTKLNYRYCFEADIGTLVDSLDFSGQELAMMAMLSGEPVMIKTINEGGDIHSEAAAGLFEIDPKDARMPIPGGNGVTYRDRGKVCIAAGSLVSTNAGLLPIEQVQPGMCAHTDLGFERVLAFIDNGISPTLKLTLEGGYQVECTMDHQLRVIDETGNYTWKEVQSISDSDWVAIKPGASVEGPKELPPVFVNQRKVTSQKSVSLPTQWTKELARFLGYFVSEGTSNHDGTGYCASYSQTLGRIADDMESVARAVWGGAVSVLKVDGEGHQSQLLIRFNRKEIFNWLRAVGCGWGCETMVVPFIVFQSPLWAQREFLRALFAGDGCITKQGQTSIAISYSSKSETLVRQVQQLALNLGCMTNVSPSYRKEYPGETYWVLTAQDQEAFLYTIGVAFKEDRFLWYSRFADNTEIPNQESHIRVLQPLLKGKLNQVRCIAGRTYSRSHKEKLYECIRPKNPVRLNYTRLAMVTSERHLSEHPAYQHLLDLERRKLAYRKVVKVEESTARVFDITVETQHCFLVNGVVAHNCMFSQAYGKTPEGFAKDWKIPVEEAKKRISAFGKRFSKLVPWLGYHGNLAVAQKYTVLDNGAMRFVGGSLGKSADSSAKRAGANAQIQGMSSWQTRIALIELDRRIREERLAVEIVGVIHDEILTTLRYHEGCAYGSLKAGLDPVYEEMKAEAASLKKLDPDLAKALVLKQEARVKESQAWCRTTCEGKDCAHRYEEICKAVMHFAGESVLKGVIKPGFSSALARHWEH